SMIRRIKDRINVESPIIIAPDVNVARLAKAISRFFHRCRGIIGDFAFVCHQIKLRIALRNKKNKKKAGTEIQSQPSPLSINIIIKAEIATKNSPAPA